MVADTDSSSSGSRSISPRISVPLPTPEGPVMTNTPAGTAATLVPARVEPWTRRRGQAQGAWQLRSAERSGVAAV